MSSKAKSTSAIGSLLDEMLAPAAPPAKAAPAPAAAEPAPVAPPPAVRADPASEAPEKPLASPRTLEPAARTQPAVAAPAESGSIVTTTIRIRSEVLERLRDYSAFSSIPMSRIITIGTEEVLDEMEKRYRARGVAIPRRQSMSAEDIASPRRR